MVLAEQVAQGFFALVKLLLRRSYFCEQLDVSTSRRHSGPSASMIENTVEDFNDLVEAD